METKKDNNYVNTMTAVLNTDGATVTLLKVEPNNHTLCIQDGTSGSDFGEDNAKRDNSGVPVLLAESSAGDGAIVPLYANSSGELMIKST